MGPVGGRGQCRVSFPSGGRRGIAMSYRRRRSVSSMSPLPLLRAILTIAVLLFPLRAHGFECGDVDASGLITSTDALRVLRRAVGLPSSLECPSESCTSTTATTSPTIVGD